MTTQDPAVIVSAGQELRRLHPLTPLMRSWRLIAGAAALGFGLFRDDMSKIQWLWDAAHGDVELGVLAKGFLVIATVAVVSVVASWLSWRVSGFAIVTDSTGASTLLYHRGLFVKQRSQIRLNRVQAVDVNQPLIPRLAGLAALRLDMAAGDESSVDLAYLRAADAWTLRVEILQHTSRPAADAPPEAAAPAPDELIAQVSTSQVVVAAMVEGAFGWIVLVLWLVALVVIAVLWGPTAVLAGLSGIIPVTLIILGDLRRQTKMMFRDANFLLWRTRNGIRVSSGLTSTTNKTIDNDRIQGIRVEEPLLWRRFGWARVRVDVAGAKGDGEHAASLMPVAPREAAFALVEDVTGVGLDDQPYAPAGDGARRVDPLGWRFLGVAVLDHGAVRRSGRWRRSTSYVPFARVQSVSADQGLLQRRLGLATIYLDLPKGAERWKARHRTVGDAVGLVRDVERRALEHRDSERLRGSR